MNNLIQKSKIMDIDFYGEIYQRLENNESNQDIIIFLKEKLKVVFSSTLIENISW
jgi:hypothetical protein